MSDANQRLDLELLDRIRNGQNDVDAREELIRKYTPMVRHIVKKTYRSTLEFDDMMQEGLIGLLNAIEEYNFNDFNVKFSSFAYLCIIRKIYNVIRQSNNYKNRTLNTAISLQSFIDINENRPLMEIISASQLDPEILTEEKWANQRLNQVLKNHLSLLEYTVISLILMGYSMKEIEEEIGISSKSVDNARSRIKFKLQRIMNEYGSLLSPKIPQKVRRRKDLCMDVCDVVLRTNGLSFNG